MRKPSALVIFLTVFIDLIGFGIVVPLVPVYSTHFGAHGVVIGMAFGLGFIFGPFIGGKSLQYFGNMGPGWAAASLCAANFLLALFILTESRKPGSAQTPPRPHVEQWLHTLNQPKVGLLVIVFFPATFCFSCFESTLPLIVGDNFHLDFRTNE